MSRDELERQAQDYLDDRLGEADRRAFEERLAADEALAARVREWRSIRRALAEDSPALPPGFYTRLRARFEAQHAPTKRRWFRPLSWETAGVVAAVAVAAVLFGPFVMNREVGRSAPEALARPSESPRQDYRMSEAAAQEPAEEGEIGKPDRDEPAAVTGADEEYAPVPESAPPAESEIEPPRREKSARQSQAPPPGLREDKGDTVGPKKSAVGEAETDQRAGSGETAPEPSAPAMDDLRLRAQGKATAEFAQTTTGVALTESVVEADQVEVIRSEARWSRAVRAGAGALGAFDPAARLVLVGPRAQPADCAASTVVLLGEVWQIRLAAAATRSVEPDHGCAFRLPADGLPVRVVGLSEDR